MAGGSGDPSFCVAGSTRSAPVASELASRLTARAIARGWQPRYVDVARSEEIDQGCALVLVVDTHDLPDVLEGLARAEEDAFVMGELTKA